MMLLFELLQHSFHIVICFVHIFWGFCPRKYNFAAYKYKHHQFWFPHSVDQPWKYLRFKGTELVVLERQTLKIHWELHVA